MLYTAYVTVEDDTRVVVFPNLPGCQTQAEPDENLLATAQEALEGWLESHLAHGEAPPRPEFVSTRPILEADAEALAVPVSSRLAFALQVRWARQDTALTQTAFAARLGVTRQMVSQLESPDSNPTLETAERVAAALHRRVNVDLVPA